MRNKPIHRGEKSALCVSTVITETDLATAKCHSVTVVLKGCCSSPDSAPHFLLQINRINVLKSNLVGFRVKLPAWKHNRRRLVAS